MTCFVRADTIIYKPVDSSFGLVNFSTKKAPPERRSFNRTPLPMIGIFIVFVIAISWTNGFAVPTELFDANGDAVDVKEVIERDPDPYISDMERSLRHGDLARVRVLSSHLMEVFPEEIDVIAMNALYQATKLQPNAYRNQIQVLEKDKAQNKFFQYAEAIILRREGKLDLAMEVCDKAIAMDPSHPYPLNIKGLINMDLKKYLEAMVYFKKSIDLEPEFSLGYANLGGVTLLIGTKEESYKYYRKALSLNPNLPAAHYGLSVLYEGIGDNLRAIEALEKCIGLDPGNEAAVKRLAALSAKTNTE